MLFRKYDGTLVEIKRYDFKNDALYYQKIMEIMMPQSSVPTLNKNDDSFSLKINSIDKMLLKLSISN
jgi:hypothetical protein